MPELNLIAQLHYKEALDGLFENDYSAAIQHLEKSLQNLANTGDHYTVANSELGIVHILCETGRSNEAGLHLKKASELIDDGIKEFLHLPLILAKTNLSLVQGDKIAFRSCLRQILASINKQHHTNRNWVHTSIIESLCLRAIGLDIETELVYQLLEVNRQLRRSIQTGGNNQLSPICIYTLGRFSLVVNGKPIKFTTKAKKKPIELLKALLAYGGRDVSEVLVCDALWPDKEGDAAHRACATTLHRLRKLLGYDEAIQCQDAKFSLSPDLCFVDLWLFERLIGEVDRFGGDVINHEEVSLLKHAISLYHGSFLESEQSYSWALRKRDKLLSKYLRTLDMLGQYYSRSGMCDLVITIYEKALETDALVEAFYHQLIFCYAGCGDVARALETYQRCRNILHTLLGTEPSRRLKDLHQILLGGNISLIDKHCHACRNNKISA